MVQILGDQMHGHLGHHSNHKLHHAELAPACLEASAPIQNQNYLLGPFVGEDNHHNLEVDTVNFEKDMVPGDDNRKDLAATNEDLVDPNLKDQ